MAILETLNARDVSAVRIFPRSDRPKSMRWFTIVFICLISFSSLFLIINPFFVMSRTMSTFIARSSEVDSLIEATYLYYYKTGAWPNSPSEFGPKGALGDWEYVYTESEGTPQLHLKRGPLHMRLEYQFRKDEAASSDGWIVHCEGGWLKHSIQERIPERPVRQEKPMHRD